MDEFDFFDGDDDLDALELILYGIPRRINIRSDYFNNFDDLSFFQRFRLTKPTVYNLLIIIEERLEFESDK